MSLALTQQLQPEPVNKDDDDASSRSWTAIRLLGDSPGLRGLAGLAVGQHALAPGGCQRQTGTDRPGTQDLPELRKHLLLGAKRPRRGSVDGVHAAWATRAVAADRA